MTARASAFIVALALAPMALVAPPASAPPSKAVERPPDASRLFAFHSGFWINLHHFLYEQAVVGSSAAEIPGLVRAESERPEDRRQLRALSHAERLVWSTALDYYRRHFVTHDLLQDPTLEKIKADLEDAEDSASLDQTGLSVDLTSVLEKAAPVYRAHWWPEHEKANSTWIGRVSPLINRYGTGLSRELATIYETPWPDKPTRVDVLAYANWGGAYTSINPTRITISSTDPNNQRTAALEIIFHEASHGLAGKVFQLERQDVERRHRLLPHRALWHAIIFYTAGELVARRIPGYTPVADSLNLWAQSWPGYRDALRKDWQPHIDGQVDLATALEKTISDLLAPSGKSRQD